MHLWKYAWDKPALILIILWEPKKEVGRSLSANNAKNLNIVEKHLWQRMMSNYYPSITWVGRMVQGVDPSIRLPPVVSINGKISSIHGYQCLYMSIPTVPVVSPLYVRLKTAMRQIQHRASTDSCKTGWKTSLEVGKWRNCEVKPLWTSKSELRKRNREPASGFSHPIALGSCLKAPVWLAPNMLAKTKDQAHTLWRCRERATKIVRWWPLTKCSQLLGDTAVQNQSMNILFWCRVHCTVAFAYFRDVQALSFVWRACQNQESNVEVWCKTCIEKSLKQITNHPSDVSLLFGEAVLPWICGFVSIGLHRSP